MLTEAELLREAADSGFRAEILEKVFRLTELLETLRSHPFLKTRIALKGGTALNLFVFDLPRLSVDVDLNYVGSADVEGMNRERPSVEQAIQAVCGRLGIAVRRTPSGHAGGKWRLTYGGVRGTGTLELDVNFLLRTPLWPVASADSHTVGSFSASAVPVLDPHELAAGKLAPSLDVMRAGTSSTPGSFFGWTGWTTDGCERGSSCTEEAVDSTGGPSPWTRSGPLPRRWTISSSPCSVVTWLPDGLNSSDGRANSLRSARTS
jgi:hypothetical protein